MAAPRKTLKELVVTALLFLFTVVYIWFSPLFPTIADNGTNKDVPVTIPAPR